VSVEIPTVFVNHADQLLELVELEPVDGEPRYLAFRDGELIRGSWAPDYCQRRTTPGLVLMLVNRVSPPTGRTRGWAWAIHVWQFAGRRPNWSIGWISYIERLTQT
jgi:hypothetical protein